MTWAYFFGLGDPQLGEAGLRDHLAQDIVRGLGREQVDEEAGQGFGVRDHAQPGREGDRARALEAVEVPIGERAQDLPGPVGAEVGHQEAVSVLHARVPVDHGGRNELVGCLAGVAPLDGGQRIGRPPALAFHHGPVGFLDSVPALVPVHGVIPPADRGHAKLAHARHVGEEPGHIAGSAGGRGVAAVQERVDRHPNPGGAEDARQGGHLVLVGVHTPRGQQSHQVAGPAARAQRRDEIPERRYLRDRAVGNGGVDARQVLHGDAPAAERRMADLGIAHLSGGQADLGGRGREARCG